jgi:nucleotide-binding universal stress UspA family protein
MKPILVALDETDHPDALLRAATHLARTLHAPLVLYRSVSAPAFQVTPDGMPLTIDVDLEGERRTRGELEALASTLPDDVPTRVTTAVDVPWQGVCEAARREDAGLIVIGSHIGHGPHPILDRLLGTTAAKVVNHADRSVLVVPDEGGPWPS